MSALQIIMLLLYFLPTAIALKKDHPQKIPIILVNIIGGWIWGIGWLVALVWCFIEPAVQGVPKDSATELERLHGLKEKGVITEEEFDSKKKRVLEDY